MIIARATASDVVEIAALDRCMWGEWANPATLYRQLIDLYPDTVYVARSEQGLYAGCALGLVRSQPLLGWVLSIDIDPRFRGIGLGKKLLTELLSAFQRLDVEVVTAIIDPTNEPSRKLFASFGFNFERREESYFGKGKDQERWVLRIGG